MDDISLLLKEAKPLYFARKKRRNRIKAVLAAVVCIWGLSLFYPQTESGRFDYDYIPYYYGENYLSENSSSVIEELGLPVDEYGLLMVG